MKIICKILKRVVEKEVNPNGVLWANQFDNQVNFNGHLNDTGPEILSDLKNELMASFAQLALAEH